MNTRPSRILATAATAALAAVGLVGCSADDADGDTRTISLGAIPSESSVTLETSYGNLVELLEQETGHPVEFNNASDYAAVVEGMRAGQIDMASFGAFTYVIAKDSGMDITPAGAPTEAEDAPPAYHSLAYVPADSDIQNIEDLAGRTVCFVDVASTSGYLVPTKGLMDAGIDRASDLDELITGGHDASLLSVAAGDCDAGFAQDSMLPSLLASGQLEEGQLRPVWESDPIPEYPLTVNQDSLGEELAAEITAVIQDKANIPYLVESGICDAAENCVLPENMGYGWVAIDDAAFDPIREICAVADAEACHAL